MQGINSVWVYNINFIQYIQQWNLYFAGLILYTVQEPKSCQHVYTRTEPPPHRACGVIGAALVVDCT